MLPHRHLTAPPCMVVNLRRLRHTRCPPRLMQTSNSTCDYRKSFSSEPSVECLCSTTTRWTRCGAFASGTRRCTESLSDWAGLVHDPRPLSCLSGLSDAHPSDIFTPALHYPQIPQTAAIPTPDLAAPLLHCSSASDSSRHVWACIALHRTRRTTR
jgi:hypothetical protein